MDYTYQPIFCARYTHGSSFRFQTLWDTVADSQRRQIWEPNFRDTSFG